MTAFTASARRVVHVLTAALMLTAGVVLLAPSSLRAQSTGRVVGRIVDAGTGAGLPDVAIQVVGTTLGTVSGMDGRYSIASVPAGTVSLHIRRIGYGPKTVTGLMLDAGRTLEQDVSLSAAALQLGAQVVTAQAERGSVSAAIDAQRRATGIVNAISSEQIARSPDGDAAAAVQRVSGVTVQDGKYVFVRGLGERYTSTSLNGARLPSPEPERKVVPLDLFPAGLLQSVTTSKTFTPDQPGDFSGALVDLRTREFPAERQVSYSLATGHNSAATGRTVFGAPREGMEWLGFAGHARGLPAAIGGANFGGNIAAGEYNTMVRSFRNAWSVQERTGSPNLSTSVSLGGSDPIAGREIGYTAALTYSYNQEVRANEVRAFAVPTPDGTTEAVDRFEGSTGRESVLWGGLFNLSTMLGSSNRISLNNTYSRSADNEARVERGFEENIALPLDIQRLRFVERSVWSSQLAGEHELGARQRLDWSVTGAGVARREPDRSEVVYAREEGGGAPFLLGASEGAVRTFGDLREHNLNATTNYHVRFRAAGRDHVAKVGGAFRYTTRDATVDSYSLQASGLPRAERERQPEEIFDGRFTSDTDNVFRVQPLSQGGSYDAMDLLGAGYAMLEYQLSDRLRLVSGARVETQYLEVTAQPTFGGRVLVQPTYTDVLPALALNVRLTDAQAVRMSASQTLARPEYREIAPVASRDVLGGEQFRGNAELKRTLIQNVDVRWEWYPGVGEVVSAGLFAKNFIEPIERVYRGTSGTRVTTFENADGATNFGAELEVRKQLGFVAPMLAPFTAFSNVTVMRSQIDLSAVGAGSVEGNRAMVGQAPYVLNAGLSYANADGRFSATALYNVVGRRIFAASLLPLPSVYEEARQVVDLSVRFPILGSMSGRVDARNLLDSPYEVTQGSVAREYYRAGRVISAGVTWRP